MGEHDRHSEPDGFGAPDGMPHLARALSALTESGPAVPREVDEAIMAEARRSLSRPRRRRWRGPVLAAASIGIAGAITWLMLQPAMSPSAVYHSAAPGPATALAGDLDGSGQLNIVDAFILARGLEAGTPPHGGDFNGDGRIDRADVDALAMRAVALDARAES
ncbi:MAG: hypothetical protein JSV91_07655 [Phycisphaerales bacterium]|nr:MAG: hypothetical protein JSV91_07655 [Phycisphaerales bacterium]